MSRIQKAQGRTTFTSVPVTMVHKTTGEKLAKITTTIAVEDLREDTSQDTLIYRVNAVLNDRYINVQPSIYSTEELKQLPAKARVLLPIAVMHKIARQEKMDDQQISKWRTSKYHQRPKGKLNQRKVGNPRKSLRNNEQQQKEKQPKMQQKKTKKIIFEESINIRNGEEEKNTNVVSEIKKLPSETNANDNLARRMKPTIVSVERSTPDRIMADGKKDIAVMDKTFDIDIPESAHDGGGTGGRG